MTNYWLFSSSFIPRVHPPPSLPAVFRRMLSTKLWLNHTGYSITRNKSLLCLKACFSEEYTSNIYLVHCNFWKTLCGDVTFLSIDIKWTDHTARNFCFLISRSVYVGKKMSGILIKGKQDHYGSVWSLQHMVCVFPLNSSSINQTATKVSNTRTSMDFFWNGH